MPNYTGSRCTVCQNAFKENDDIVVCPDCGTPYHRSCYAVKGACINTELHKTGGSWQALQSEKREKLGGRECPNCHYVNRPDSENCEVCHTRLHAQEEQRINVMLSDGRTMEINPMDPCCGMSPDEELEGERLGDVASFVGTNTLYYIPLFKRFKETGRKISVNLPCLLFPHLYFANRKMWLMAFLTIIVMALFSIPSMFATMEMTFTEEAIVEMAKDGFDLRELAPNLLAFLKDNSSLIRTLDMLFYGIQLTIRVILCVFANWIYYRHALDKVKKLRNSKVSPKMKQMLLRSDGGTSFANVFGAILLNYAVVFVIMLVIMMPMMM